MKFNEATRVQIPTIVHLTRLGYKYYEKPFDKINYDQDTNILLDIFKTQLKLLNPESDSAFNHLIQDIKQELDYDDLGRSFYKRLVSNNSIKLIDFDNPENNVFHCIAEFTCKRDQDQFRPDITLFINGLPLVLIEVKKPNNNGGIIAESERMNKQRLPNKKFRRFINMTQFLIFSNNMEYDTLGGIVPIEGAFYSTIARNYATFNCFREENTSDSVIAPFIQNYPYNDIDNSVETQILKDFNSLDICNSDEYISNKDINTPTNRIITSMCSPARILFILKYGLTYVTQRKEDANGKFIELDEKHIMRYQQLFASLAVKNKLKDGIKSGVIWHTQGSGKTALTFYLTKILTDYFAQKEVITKFYFVVDRLDLLTQASMEFEARGLAVKTANSRKELMKQFRETNSQTGICGKAEITVINIQRFAEDINKIELYNYATHLQRIFIIDEAHRSYNPKGCFLSNLFEADKNSIKLALTGTPLLSQDRASWKVFGDYIHTYYYDKSIQDGYTLKIIREDIETSYKERLSEIYDQLEVLIEKKDIKKNQIVEHDNYVKELVKYIIADFNQFRLIHGDNTLGGMVICETSNQAKNMYKFFEEMQSENHSLNVGLILHDSNDKDTRKLIVNDFKENMTIDILIVYNMLLTGFDAKRLKRLYFGRKLKDHNLLQALTRVNRPYKQNRYGYVIDFADIKQNFDDTNKAYLEELNRFNDPNQLENAERNTFADVLEDKDMLIAQMHEAKQILFNYSTDNLEKFSLEISNIENKSELLELKKVLIIAKDCCNIVRNFGDDDLKDIFKNLEITKLPNMIFEIQNRIDIINQKELFVKDNASSILINDAMQNITFNFTKIGEEELQMVDGGSDLKNKWTKTTRGFASNVDPDDPEFISLQKAFVLKFKQYNFTPDSVQILDEYSNGLDEFLTRLSKLDMRNNALLKKYDGDIKFVRIHKRIHEKNVSNIYDSGNTIKYDSDNTIISKYEDHIVAVLSHIKHGLDQQIGNKSDILNNDAFFEKTIMKQISQAFRKLDVKSNRDNKIFLKTLISKQYLEQSKTD
ncbi:MAG: deoxyribonuclease HsdR [Candidatus Epulonipiscioides saccharophilum]|nr:MAG: deoxyribonuclease HsdR [Epulopiscium sp. AS2M-Bin001]